MPDSLKQPFNLRAKWRSVLLFPSTMKFWISCKLILATTQGFRSVAVYLWPPHQSYEPTEELKEYSDDTLRPLDSSLPRRSCGRMLKVSWVSIKVGKRTGDTDSRVQSNTRSCSSVLVLLLYTSGGPNHFVLAHILGVLITRKLFRWALKWLFRPHLEVGDPARVSVLYGPYINMLSVWDQNTKFCWQMWDVVI